MPQRTTVRFQSRIGVLALAAAVLLFSRAAVAQVQEKELDTPYVPTPQAVVDKMLDMAQVKSGDTVIDLGSGDGRIIITAAQRLGARGFGVEIDPRLVRRSNEEALRLGVADRVKFLQQDLFNTDFRDADVLTLYLLPDVNIALRPKILSELKPGTRVVSHDFGMREWRPDKEETVSAPEKSVGTRKESSVYLWIVPARIAGEWTFELGSGGKTRKTRLTLKQSFQFVSGSVELAGQGDVSFSSGRLRGDELRLVLPGGALDHGPVELVGKVNGALISGTVRRANRDVANWSARRRS
ncbi:MAG TPA: methyltransferase domain-containing protein [Burkholderiales bacterium]|nr:methyltransferase domain-containing protein [Burkholderiales bacterium]